MRIPATKLCMESQPKYMLNTSRPVKPAGDMLLVELGNQAGFDTYSTTRTYQTRADFLKAVLQALNSNLPVPARVTATIRARATAILDNYNTPQQRT
jgi:hypothetical protein